MRQYRWLMALVVGAFFIAACGGLQSESAGLNGQAVSISGTDISGQVVTVPADAEVLDYGMVPLAANTTEIEGCTFVWKLDLGMSQTVTFVEGTIDAPASYGGSITFSISGTKAGGYDIEVSDTIDGYTAVIERAYFGIGNNARKFTFDPGVTSAGPLPAPDNPSENLGDISHTHFCFGIVSDDDFEVEEECEWQGETAWSAGDRYSMEQGNWATYTVYDGVATTVTLFAGQTLEAGTVTFAVPEDGKVEISIDLNPGWRLEQVFDEELDGFVTVAEAVKVQGYATEPSGNPSPGLFTTYKGVDLVFTVDEADFYGVHVNVEQELCVPVTDEE